MMELLPIEVPALVAGERCPAALADDDRDLPRPCVSHVCRRTEDARQAKDDDLIEQLGEDGYDDMPQEDFEAAIAAAGDLAAVAAGREWDASIARARTTVDRIDGLHLRTLTTVSTAALMAGAA